MASVCHELVWGILMNPARLTIAVVGSGLHLTLSAAYLAEKLQYLKPIVLAVQLPEEESDKDFSFAFPPFSEPVSPILRQQLAESSLRKIDLYTPSFSAGFGFNFSTYGVVSAGVSFPQAYQICAQNVENFPGYDSFLENKTVGIIYNRKLVAEDYRCLAVKKDVVFIPCKSIHVIKDEGKILAVETADGQRVTADYFIDCSSKGQLMACVQERVSISEDVLPSWSVRRNHLPRVAPDISCTYKFESSQMVSAVNYGQACYEKTSDFNAGDTLSEYFQSPWSDNCITVGRGFAEMPEFLIDLDRMLEKQLMVLSWLIGANSQITYSTRHFNTLSMRYFDEAIDTVNLMLCGAGIAQELTPGNQRRVELFQSSASTIKENNVFISENNWSGLLHAAGYKPTNTNAFAASTSVNQIVGRTKSLISR
jgi:hypothetical protein